MGEGDFGSSDTLPADSASSSSNASAAGAALPEVIAGRYRVLAWIGAGGMGNVYKVRDQELDEIVALKVIRREIAASADAVSRFRREAKLARMVTHKNVARTFEFGEHAGERFLTMELVDGASLGERIDRNGALSIDEALRIALMTCEGLSAAHASNVVHRDLKPDNILVERSGRVVLTDFGIACATADGDARTLGGRIVGTPAYMAPEQVEAKEVDARTDLYALGAVLYEMLTGTRAWPGDAPLAVAAARLLHPPPDPRDKRPEIGEEIARIVLRLLARAPGERFASAAEVASALQRVPRGDRSSIAPPAAFASAATRREKIICVLPFRNGGAVEDAIFAEGVTDDVIDALSTTPGLRVCARATVERLASRDPRELGRGAGAQIVIEGAVRRAGETMRLTARAINVEDGIQLWATRVDRPVRELLVATDELARAAAEALTEGMQKRPRESVDPRALELYFRGRAEIRGGFVEHVVRALPYFEEALALAPDDPTILAGYSNVLLRLSFQQPARAPELMPRARTAAERALVLSPSLDDAHVALAMIDYNEGALAQAVRRLASVLRTSPQLGMAHEGMGRILIETGPLERAMSHCRVAILDPSSGVTCRSDLARAHAFRGEWDAVTHTLAFSDPALKLGRTLYTMRLGLWRGVMPALDEPLPDVRDAGGLSAQHFLRLYESILRGDGVTDEDVAKLDQGARGAPTGSKRRAMLHQFSCEVYAATGRDGAALDALEGAFASGFIDAMWLEHCPLLRKLRAEPRFQAVRAGVGARIADVLAALAS
jgi:serine/threonine-protein kinase